LIQRKNACEKIGASGGETTWKKKEKHQKRKRGISHAVRRKKERIPLLGQLCPG